MTEMAAPNRRPDWSDRSDSELVEDLVGLKVLIVHDWILTWAGSERVLDQILSLFPHADLVVAIADRTITGAHLPAVALRELWLGRVPGARRFYQWLLPLEALAFQGVNTSQYDIVVSSSHAFAKAVRPGRRGVHLCYCYSPPRYLWDLHDTYMERANWHRRLAMGMGRRMLQRIDRWSASHVTHFVGISRFVAERIRRVYDRPARVVYPPVKAKPSSTGRARGARGDFVLYLGRLAPYKRVDVIVRAAARHGVRTIIAGDGPERARLEALAGRHVEFVGAVSEAEAGRLLDECAAFVFCADEDFGIAPLEANAHGAPVVALRSGAIIETMQHGETAVLFDEPTPEAVTTAVLDAMRLRWDEDVMKGNAARFGAQRFRNEFLGAVHAALAGESW